jgi:hypothetical protein
MYLWKIIFVAFCFFAGSSVSASDSQRVTLYKVNTTAFVKNPAPFRNSCAENLSRIKNRILVVAQDTGLHLPTNFDVSGGVRVVNRQPKAGGGYRNVFGCSADVSGLPLELRWNYKQSNHLGSSDEATVFCQRLMSEPIASDVLFQSNEVGWALFNGNYCIISSLQI